MTKPTLTDAEVDDIIRAAMADEGCAPVPDWMDRAIYRAGYERGYAAGLAAGVLREQRRKMDCRNASGCLYTLNQCAEVGYCIRAAPRAQAGSTGGEEMACRAVLDSVAGELAGLHPTSYRTDAETAGSIPVPPTPIPAPAADTLMDATKPRHDNVYGAAPPAAPADDLVERLRAPDLSCSKGQRGDIHIEAADAIAALRAENERLTRERDEARNERELHHKARVGMQHERDEAQRSGVTTANYWKDRAERAESAQGPANG